MMDRRSIAVAGLVCVVLLAAFDFLFWKPETHSLTAARKAHVTASARVDGLTASLMDLSAEKRDERVERSGLKALQEAVPTSPSLSEALTQLDHAAETSGVALTSISPSVPASYVPSSSAGTSAASSASTGTAIPGGATAIDLTVVVGGSYFQVLHFLQAVDSLPRLFVETSVTIAQGSGTGSSGKASSGLSLSLDAEMFYSLKS